MHSTTATPAQRSALPQDTESLLLAHSLSAFNFHADCREQYRWGARARDLAEWIDSVLAHRFATTLVLIGVPALAIATLV
jgi:hypothetical protein